MSFSLVKTVAGRDSAHITGVGVCVDGTLRAEDDSSLPYWDAASPDSLPFHEINYDAQSWGFPTHDACWELLLTRLTSSLRLPEPPDVCRIVQILFELLQCLPVDRHSVSFPTHDFDGASHLWRSPKSLPANWEFLAADPRPYCFAPWPRRPCESASLDPDVLVPARHSGHSRDCFSTLPPEVVQLVANWLSSVDLCNLRLASRSSALLTRPSLLPQSFWRTRFEADREMGFMGCLEPCPLPGHGTDWRELYYNIREGLRNRSETGHLRSRRRIWNALHHIAHCLVPLYHQPIRRADPDMLAPRLQSRGYTLGSEVRGRERHGIGRNTGASFRLFGKDYLPMHFPGPEPLSLEFCVSFITYDCTDYVCGIRVVEQHEATASCGQEMARVGLIRPVSEAKLSISPNDCLSGLSVSTSASGVQGMSFHFGGTTGSIFPVGAVEILPPGVGIATLRPAGGRSIVGLVVGFDVGSQFIFPLRQH